MTDQSPTDPTADSAQPPGERATDGLENASVSRRSVLQASGSALAGGAVAASGAGLVRADGDDDGDDRDYCSETTWHSKILHYDDSIDAVCSDDHPATQELQSDVAASLEENFPTVGALIDDGYIPYFDFLTANRAARWSHWLNPDYLGDDDPMDPERPESVLVDHKWWRPIGVMFVATRDGEGVDPPPTVYETDEGEACTPWHTHVGFPGRFGWWKYRLLYGDAEGSLFDFPCRTPWMLHMWIYDHPDSLYAHHGPPTDQRGGPPAEPAGFETDAVPGEDLLGPSVLPDVLLDRLKHDP